MGSHVISSGSTAAYSVKSGATLVVGAGGESEGSKVSSGGKETVLSGGQSVEDTVLCGGLLTLSSGALAETLSVSPGGLVQAGAGVIEGMTLSGQLISGSVGVAYDMYGTLEIASGGGAQDVSIAYGDADVDACCGLGERRASVTI